MQLPVAYARLMIDAVASFAAELRSSPTELEVVTGLPGSTTAELLSRLQAALSAPSGAPGHLLHTGQQPPPLASS